MPNRTWILRLATAAALMAVAANCFLKYLWWAACYSAWSGIPKLSTQWKAAGSRVTLYGWSLILLEAASVALVYSVMRLRPGFSRNAARLVLSLILTIASTALLALLLSWVKQGPQ